MVAEVRLRVRVLQLTDLDAGTIERWDSLGERALEPNAYLSPWFILPALRCIYSEFQKRNTLFFFVERPSLFGSDFVGAGIFMQARGELSFPLPHLKSFRSDHSYLTGFLVDRDEGEAALRALFDFFGRNGSQWHGLDFEDMPSGGAQAELVFRMAQEFGCSWHERMRASRAVFVPMKGGDTYLQTHLSTHRLKRLRQAWRRLERKGNVEWKMLYGPEVTASHIESFLDLEHRGWKAEKGTSIRSRQSHEGFFREMVENFRKRGCLFFTELLLDEAVIASTSNLVSGGAGFAFKVGWDPHHADTSPGLMNELAFVRGVAGPCRNLAYIDSGAESGSFVDFLWSGRRTLSSGIFGITPLGRFVLSGTDRLRTMKHHWQNARAGLVKAPYVRTTR
jgi:hypothetical protein